MGFALRRCLWLGFGFGLGLPFHEGVVYGTGGDMVAVHIIREHDDLVSGRFRGRIRVGVGVGLG